MVKDIILHTIKCEKRLIKNNTVGIMIFLLFSTVLTTEVGVDSNSPDANFTLSYAGTISFLNMAFIILTTVVAGSHMFRCINSKQDAIQFLMLPASNIDKFISRILIGTVGYALMFFIAMLGADILQALFFLATYKTADSLTLHFLTQKLIAPMSSISSSADLWETIEYSVLFHAIYTLGSSMFKKHPFILTSTIVIVTSLTFAAILTFTLAELALYKNEMVFEIVNNPGGIQEWIMKAVLYAFIAFCYWFSYKKFCKRTINSL